MLQLQLTLGNFAYHFILELLVFLLDWAGKMCLVGTHGIYQLFSLSALVFFTNPSLKDANKFTLNTA